MHWRAIACSVALVGALVALPLDWQTIEHPDPSVSARRAFTTFTGTDEVGWPPFGFLVVGVITSGYLAISRRRMRWPAIVTSGIAVVIGTWCYVVQGLQHPFDYGEKLAGFSLFFAAIAAASMLALWMMFDPMKDRGSE